MRRALLLTIASAFALAPFAAALDDPTEAFVPLDPPAPAAAGAAEDATPRALPPFVPFDDVAVPVPLSQNEFSIAVNPVNPDHLVAGANDYGFDGDAETGVYVSFDGGRTWRHDYLLHGPRYTFSGDPVLAFSPDGSVVYYAGLASNRVPTNNGANALFLAKSTDGGLTWTRSYPFTHPDRSVVLDKPWIAVDPATGAIALTYSHFYGPSQGITFTMSRDGGETWTPRKVLGPLGQTSLPAFGENGEIFVTWRVTGAAAFAASLDGGATWTVSQPISAGLVAPVPFRYSNMPVMDVARGGPHAGRVYLAAPGYDVVGGEYDLRVVWSDDAGRTWSAPERVAWPGAPLMPWMAIQPDGTVGLASMSALATPAGTRLSQVLHVKGPRDAAWSTTVTSDAVVRAEGVTFWGDYQGLAASSRAFHPAFGDTRAGPSSANAALDLVTMRVAPLALPTA